MKQLNFLIKPSSSLCNMQCRYCFYADISDKRMVKSYGLMSVETAECLISSAFSAIDPGGEITFAFQGGEPTLVGLSFYKTFIKLEKKHEKPGVTVHHMIQTNGYSINEDWAAFFFKHNFLVGLSIDGTRAIHNLYRIDSFGSGTWKNAANSLQLLQKNHVDVNLLCVVTKQCARNPQKVYHTLKKLGAGYLQFIPCLDPLDIPRGEDAFSLTPEAYSNFLCGLFDAWYLDWKVGQYTSIRLFDDYVHILMRQPSSSCTTSVQCGHYLVVEGDGGLYPCDFYVLDNWFLGNIRDVDLAQIDQCKLVQDFLEESRHHPNDCKSCQWYFVCCGGCKRDWYMQNGIQKNYYCSSFQKFFAYYHSRLHEIVVAEFNAIHSTAYRDLHS